jgi:signal transduction histidine kinase
MMAEFEIPWQELVEAAPDGLCVLNGDGTVQYANPAALRLLGLSAPEGAPAAEWLGQLGGPHQTELLDVIERGGQLQLRLPNADCLHLLVEALPLAAERGMVVRIRPDHEVETAEAMAVLIHDLRLPMTSIIGYARMLQTIDVESLSEMQRQFLDTIDRNVMRLDKDLKAAQDMTRIDRGQIRLTFTAQSPALVTAEVLRELQPLVDEKQHRINLDFPDDLPAVRADAERLKQTLSLLLDNALKYTRPNGDICVRGRQVDGMVQIDVEDNGLGVPFAEQGRVFEKFFRGENERIREYSGLGLSLFIARGLAELQDGELVFKSKPGQGSVFSLVLPISKDD